MSELELISKYSVEPDYVDSDTKSTIIDKHMSTITGITLSGEKNSQYITFIMDRYADGIDLSEKLINICYSIPSESVGGLDAPMNVYRNDNQIEFGWLIPPCCTDVAKSIVIGILVTGTQNTRDYVWKSFTSEYSITKGFEIGEGITEPDDNWFEQFLIQIDNKIANAQLGGGSGSGGTIDLSNYYTKTQVDEKIPTKTSDLENDSNFMTTDNVTLAIQTYITNNNIGSVSQSDIETIVSAYLTEHPVSATVSQEDIAKAIDSYFSNNSILDNEDVAQLTANITNAIHNTANVCKLRPNLCATENLSTGTIDEILNGFVSTGFTEIVLNVGQQIDLDTNEVTTVAKVDYIINKCKELGLIIKAVKMSEYSYVNNDHINYHTLTTTQFANVKANILSVATKFKDYDLDWFTAFNEAEQWYRDPYTRLYTTPAYGTDESRAFVLDTINACKALGIKTGITFMGVDDFRLCNEEIRASLDFIGINIYNEIGLQVNGTYNTYNDVESSWHCIGIDSFNIIHRDYGVPIGITETGILNTWTNSVSDETKQQFYRYYLGLFNSLKDVDIDCATIFWAEDMVRMSNGDLAKQLLRAVNETRKEIKL